MAFGLPESAGIPRLAHIVFMVKGNPQLNSHKKSLSSTRHLDHELQLPLLFVPRCLHSPMTMAILAGYELRTLTPSCIT